MTFQIITLEMAKKQLTPQQVAGLRGAVGKLPKGVIVRAYRDDGTFYRIMAVPRADLEPVPASAVELTPEPEPTSEPEPPDDLEEIEVVDAGVPEDKDEPVEEVDVEDEDEPVEEVDVEDEDEPDDEEDVDADDGPAEKADDEEAELARRIAARDAANVQFPDYVLEQLTDPNHPIHKLGIGKPFRLPEAFATRMEVYKLLPEGEPLKATLRAFGLDTNAWRQNHVLLYFEGGEPQLRLLNKTVFNPARDSIPFPDDF